MKNKKKKLNRDLKIKLMIARLAFFTALLELIKKILDIVFK